MELCTDVWNEEKKREGKAKEEERKRRTGRVQL